MPKVKITNSYGTGYTEGKEYEVDEKTATWLIEKGRAIPVKSDQPETASAKREKTEKR